MRDFSKIATVPQAADIIAQYNTGNVFSKLITIAGDFDGKHEPVSHVGIYIGGGERLIAEAFWPDGLRIVPLDKYFKQQNSISVYRVKGITVTQASAVKNTIYSELKRRTGFDIAGLLGVLLFKLFHLSRKRDNFLSLHNAYFCSEQLDNIFRTAGIDLFSDIGNGLVTPDDVVSSNKVELIARV